MWRKALGLNCQMRTIKRMVALLIMTACELSGANYGSSSSVIQNVCAPAIRECRHSPGDCCDSSLCFIVTRTRSSEERVLSTATLRTMLPFNPVSPACFDPLTVMM